MKYTLTSCCILLAVLLFSCKPELPPITRVGANSMGALVDGVVWLPQISGLQPNITASFSDTDSLLRVTATNLSDGTYFLWELKPLPANGSYTVDEWTAHGIKFEYGEIAETTGGDPTPYTTVPGSAALEITLLDGDNGVFAGEFSFEATDPAGKNLEIMDGRFDFRF